MDYKEFLSIKEKAGLTYKQISNRVGMSNKMVYNYANGDNPIPEYVASVMQDIKEECPPTIKELQMENKILLDIIATMIEESNNE